MNDQVLRVARAAAERLADELDQPSIVDEVEGELFARTNGQRPHDYLDPIALGSLVVSVANLAWVIWMDRRKAKKPTTPEEFTRQVGAELSESEAVTAQDRERIITVVAIETIRSEQT